MALSCLTLWSCSSTAELTAIDTRSLEPPRVPAALTRPCPPPQRGPLPTTAAIVNRLLYTEGALKTCAAQVDGVAAWDAANAAAGAERAGGGR